MLKRVFSFLFFILLFGVTLDLQSQNKQPQGKEQKERVGEARVTAAQQEVEIIVKNVDISNFPEVRIIIEAYNKYGQTIDTLEADNIFVFENNVPKTVKEVFKIPITEKKAVDFIFMIDITGSMQPYINQIRQNVSTFARNLISRGIDYRLGLILFTDDMEKMYQPSRNTLDIIDWLTPVKAQGGGDEKENALEAIDLAVNYIKYREDAERVLILVTDAPYHQRGEGGHGVTRHSTESVTKLLQESQTRLFSIVPPKLTNYEVISRASRGNFFDIDYPFSTILDNFSNQLTNLYYVIYNSEDEAIPDSIEIALFNVDNNQWIKKMIPIVELGRKLIIENLLFETNSSVLPQEIRELDILAEFLINKKEITILIEGHTDSIGSDVINDALSLKRAESVKEYLAKRGIESERMEIVGYGKRRPITSNSTEFGRKLNRRTEIVILSTE
jgi:outer membrane protein OmpA-like peptidoglycan-associated protein/Mg-chelatase subunit ChlD